MLLHNYDKKCIIKTSEMNNYFGGFELWQGAVGNQRF